MTIYIYKEERLQPALNPDQVLEVSKRRWPLKTGDILLFTRGSGEELRFLGTVEVLDVERGIEERKNEEGELERLHTAKVMLGQFEALPEDRTLGGFMFSLIRISNFGRPQLHIRHRSRIDAEDLETLEEGHIHLERSLFFGLLRHLPRPWRTYFEHTSVARRAFRGGAAYPQRLPVLELVTLLRRTAIQAVELAAETEPFARRALMRLGMPSGRLEVVPPEPENGQRSWDLSALLRRAPSLHQHLEADWGIVNELLQEYQETANHTERRKERTWRPHRW